MPTYAVSTEFAARDRISAVLTQMDKRAKITGRSLKSSFDKGSAAAARFQSVTKDILKAQALVKGAQLVKEGVRAVTTEYVGFDDAITAASAKFKDINLNTEAGRAKMDALRKSARKAGADTEFSATQGAQAIDFFAMAGFNAAQSMAMLPGATDLATIANVDLARSTDIASDSLGAFGLMTKDTVQLEKNFTRQNDVMAMTMSRTNTGLEDLFESIKKGAPAFTAAGQRMETFNAMAGIMANSGVKGAESGTQLRNVMLKLAKPTDEAQKTLDMLGVRTQDAQGNFRDVIDILADFELGLQGMGTKQKSAALATVFGARSVTGINILLATGVQKIRAFRDELDKSTGATKKMAAIMRTSLGNRLKAIQSAAIEVGFKIFSAFHDRGIKAIEAFTERVRKFDPQPIINGIEVSLKLFTGLWNVIKFLSPAFLPLISYMIAYGVVTKAVVAIDAIKYFIQMTKAIKGATAAQWLLNAAQWANPVGLVIAGVTALIFIVIKLIKHWDKVTKLFKATGRWIGRLFGVKPEEEPIEEPAYLQGETGTKPGGVEAPNRRQVEAVTSGRIGFEGRLNIAGAPAGSTVESRTVGAPPVEVALLGENP
jgi:TP901 family phage tail tape measure protein